MGNNNEENINTFHIMIECCYLMDRLFGSFFSDYMDADLGLLKALDRLFCVCYIKAHSP